MNRELTCPVCLSSMEIQRRHGLEIDRCPHCRSVFLDPGELDIIIERSGLYLEVPGTRAGKHLPVLDRREKTVTDAFEWF